MGLFSRKKQKDISKNQTSPQNSSPNLKDPFAQLNNSQTDSNMNSPMEDPFQNSISDKSQNISEDPFQNLTPQTENKKKIVFPKTNDFEITKTDMKRAIVPDEPVSPNKIQENDPPLPPFNQTNDFPKNTDLNTPKDPLQNLSEQTKEIPEIESKPDKPQEPSQNQEQTKTVTDLNKTDLINKLEEPKFSDEIMPEDINLDSAKFNLENPELDKKNKTSQNSTIQTNVEDEEIEIKSDIDEEIENVFTSDKNKELESSKVDKEINTDETEFELPEKLPPIDKEINLELENIKKQQKLISPDEIVKEKNLKLPQFNDSNNDKTDMGKEKYKRKQIKGDLFVKTYVYREILQANLQIQNNIKSNIEKIRDINQILETEAKTTTKYNKNMIEIQKDLMIMEDKLFEENNNMR